MFYPLAYIQLFNYFYNYNFTANLLYTLPRWSGGSEEKINNEKLKMDRKLAMSNENY